jgi:NDP-sugar pyrophosphorylase family protein
MKRICEWLREVVDDFPDFEYPWEIIQHLQTNQFASSRLQKREVEGLEAEVYCGKNVDIQPYVLFSGQVFIDDDTRIGPYTFLRGPMIVGKKCLIGPHGEIIRTIMQDGSTLAHKNLMGDAIIGENVSCAGMSVICNTPFGASSVKCRYYEETQQIDGKYGTLIGDRSQLGALTIMMPGCHVHPNTTTHGQCVIHGSNKIKSMIRTKEAGVEA